MMRLAVALGRILHKCGYSGDAGIFTPIPRFREGRL